MKAKLREDRREAIVPNEAWAMNLVHDQLAARRKMRNQTAVYTFTRFPPIIDPRFCYRAEDVVEASDHVCRQIGFPKAIRLSRV